jgi:hypothetical protein
MEVLRLVLCVCFGCFLLFFRFDNAALQLQNYRDVRIESSVKSLWPTTGQSKRNESAVRTFFFFSPKQKMASNTKTPGCQTLQAQNAFHSSGKLNSVSRSQVVCCVVLGENTSSA